MRATFASLLLVALSSTAMPQGTTGRTMHLLAPAVVGHTASYRVASPASAAGNSYAFLWCSPPFSGVGSITVPGITFLGALRIDLSTSVTVATGTLGASGSPTHSFAIPNVPSLVGYAWDLQSADLATSTMTVSFSDNELALVVSDAIRVDMVPIAAGSFQMGSTQGNPTELPVHTVHITRPFWVGKYEVTQAEYQALMGNNPSYYQGASYPNAPARPVERVSWNDAMAFCRALTVQEAAASRLPTGYEYRLPTEAEWEYCCRAGTTTEWNVGSSLDCNQANFWPYPSAMCVGGTSVVGSYGANAWGLHDMHGNVWEACLDWWDVSANYPVGPVSDPYVTTGFLRINRGGAWGRDAFNCRSAKRGPQRPSNVSSYVGFRVVLAPIL